MSALSPQQMRELAQATAMPDLDPAQADSLRELLGLVVPVTLPVLRAKAAHLELALDRVVLRGAFDELMANIGPALVRASDAGLWKRIGSVPLPTLSPDVEEGVDHVGALTELVMQTLADADALEHSVAAFFEGAESSRFADEIAQLPPPHAERRIAIAHGLVAWQAFWYGLAFSPALVADRALELVELAADGWVAQLELLAALGVAGAISALEDLEIDVPDRVAEDAKWKRQLAWVEARARDQEVC